MERAFQSILVAGEESMAKVITGNLKATVRFNHRDYTPGPVLIGCHILNWARLFYIKEVKHITLVDLVSPEIYSAGYDSYESMFKNMQKFYPEITHNSPVTFIRWDICICE